jgi:hypothetical protein
MMLEKISTREENGEAYLAVYLLTSSLTQKEY